MTSITNAWLLVDALRKTDNNLFLAVDGINSWRGAITQRGYRVKLYRDYEQGDSRSAVTSQMRQMLRLQLDETGLSELTDNYVALVVDKFAGRVAIEEISGNDPGADLSWLEPMLDKQDFKAAEGMWWRGAIRDGDSFVLIDPATQLWSSEPAFDGFSGMVAIYNQLTRKPVWACKIWTELDTKDRGVDSVDTGGVNWGGLPRTMRLIVYQPNRITYWKGLEGTAILGEDGLPIKDKDGNPVTDAVTAWAQNEATGSNEEAWPAEMAGKLPFVSFANKRDAYTRYGESEVRQVIPLQDVLNRTLVSMVGASEFAAFKLAYSIGMEIDPAGMMPGGIINLVLKNASGIPITDFTPEQIAFLNACKIGQLAETNITQYTNQGEWIVKEISQSSQTPLYGIQGGGRISGDALKQLEIGLIGKCERFQRQNSDSLKELIMLTAQMERLFSPGKGTPDVKSVALTWKSPVLLEANDEIAALTALRVAAPDLFADNFYQVKIGQLLGMSKKDIAGEIAAAKKQNADKQALLDKQNAEKAAATPPPSPAAAVAQIGEPTGAKEPTNTRTMGEGA